LAEIKRLSLVKPTIHTRFHIDFDWWQQNDQDWRVYLRSFLCPEHQLAFDNAAASEEVDWVDPDTAEVQRVDGLQNTLITHCARQSAYIEQHAALVDSVFRILLVNGNTPMTPEELGQSLKKDSLLILRTLTGPRIYKGLRPVLE
jgi:hypothetical protein